MADKAKDFMRGLHTEFPLVGGTGGDGKFSGALALTTWIKASDSVPGGEYMFMVGDEAFRHSLDPELNKMILPNGEAPIEFVYFDKNPEDFWGYGLCEALVPSQLSSDREATLFERNLRKNRALTFYDPDRVMAQDIQDEDASLIPTRRNALDDSRSRMVEHFPAQPIGQDVIAALELSQRRADTASGFRSGIVLGQQEGRTESGPATSLLSQNAMSSLVPVFSRLDTAWKRTYEGVLDWLRFAWPEGKTLRVAGPNNVGRELKVQREDIPPSSEIIIHPRPMIPGGRNALTSILFQLRQMPGEDGTMGSEVKSREFRRSLQKMNLLPPGIDMEDRASSRLQGRINQLIGDGQKPYMAPSDPRRTGDRLELENHRIAVEMLKDAILDDSYLTYSPAVRRGLLMQFRFHMDRTFNATEGPNNFDDDLEKFDSLQAENFLSTAEADLETLEGDLDLTLEG